MMPRDLLLLSHYSNVQSRGWIHDVGTVWFLKKHPPQKQLHLLIRDKLFCQYHLHFDLSPLHSRKTKQQMYFWLCCTAARRQGAKKTKQQISIKELLWCVSVREKLLAVTGEAGRFTDLPSELINKNCFYFSGPVLTSEAELLSELCRSQRYRDQMVWVFFFSCGWASL